MLREIYPLTIQRFVAYVATGWALTAGVFSAGVLTAGATLSLAGATGAAGTTREAVELRAAVLVDVVGGVVYAMKPGGGLEALRADDGTVLWSTEAASKPLYADETVLVAQIEGGDPQSFRVASVDLADPPAASWTADRKLPPGVRPLVEVAPTARFDARAGRDGDRIYVTWSFRRGLRGPTPDARPAPPIEGTFWYDAASGDPVAGGPAPGFSPPSPPDTVRWTKTDAMAAAPAWTGKVWAGTTVDDGRVFLARWNADGEPLPSRPALSESRPAVQLPSVDHRHLLLSRRAAEESGGYLWRVVSMDTGEELGTVPGPSSALPFVVHDSVLVTVTQPSARRIGGEMHTEPMMLRGFDLNSGTQRWARPLRDPVDRGAPPPR